MSPSRCSCLREHDHARLVDTYGPRLIGLSSPSPTQKGTNLSIATRSTTMACPRYTLPARPTPSLYHARTACGLNISFIAAMTTPRTWLVPPLFALTAFAHHSTPSPTPMSSDTTLALSSFSTAALTSAPSHRSNSFPALASLTSCAMSCPSQPMHSALTPLSLR